MVNWKILYWVMLAALGILLICVPAALITSNGMAALGLVAVCGFLMLALTMSANFMSAHEALMDHFTETSLDQPFMVISNGDDGDDGGNGGGGPSPIPPPQPRAVMRKQPTAPPGPSPSAN